MGVNWCECVCLRNWCYLTAKKVQKKERKLYLVGFYGLRCGRSGDNGKAMLFWMFVFSNLFMQSVRG